MSSGPAPNANVPQVPQPLTDVGSLTYVARSLKQGMDSLAGYRGHQFDRAVTYNDLLALKLTTAEIAAGQVPAKDIVGFVPSIVPYAIGAFSGSVALGVSQVIFGSRFPVQVSFLPNFGPLSITMFSLAGSFVNATGGAVLTIEKCLNANNPTVGGNWTTVGTVTFGAGGHDGTLDTLNTAVLFLKGDYMRIRGPAAPDPTLAQIYVTLTGKRQGGN